MGCNGCSKHNRVLGYNTFTGKHLLRDEEGTEINAELVTDSLVHGFSKTIRFGDSFAAAEARPIPDVTKRKWVESPPELVIAFVMRFEYDVPVEVINAQVPCYSPYWLAIIDETEGCAGIGGTCARYCATLEVAEPPPPGIGTEYFAGLPDTECLSYNQPGTIFDFNYSFDHSFALGPWGQSEVFVEVVQDFPNLIPSRYRYELIVSGQSTFEYYGQCFFGAAPFGLITRYTNSAGVITGGLPLNFCVPECQSDMATYPSNWYVDKQFEVQSQNSCLYRNLFFGEWSLSDWDRNLFISGDDDQNFKYSLPLGKYDNTCFIDPVTRVVEFGDYVGAGGEIPWTAQLQKPMAAFYWGKNGSHRTLGAQTLSLERLQYNRSTFWWDTNFEPVTKVIQYALIFPVDKDPDNWLAVPLTEMKEIEHDYAPTLPEGVIGLVSTENNTLHATLKNGYYEPLDIDTGDQLFSVFADVEFNDGAVLVQKNLTRDGTLQFLRPTGMYAYEAYILPGDDIPLADGDITPEQVEFRHTHSVLLNNVTKEVTHNGGLTGSALGQEIITNNVISWDLTEGLAVTNPDTQEITIQDEVVTPNILETSNIITAIDTMLDNFHTGLTTEDLTAVDVIRIKAIV